MDENLANLKHGGFTVIRNFFSTNDVAHVCDEYQNSVSALPSNGNYDVKLGSLGLNRHFEQRLDVVSQQVFADAGIHADVTAGSIYFRQRRASISVASRPRKLLPVPGPL